MGVLHNFKDTLAGAPAAHTVDEISQSILMQGSGQQESADVGENDSHHRREHAEKSKKQDSRQSPGEPTDEWP